MNPTDTPIPDYTDLVNDIHAVMREHENDARFDYFVDAYAAVLKARRVTRLDLYELLNAVTDFGRIDPDRHFTSLNSLIAVNNVNRVFAAMDYAAAFASSDYPLVIESRGLSAIDYTVTRLDSRKSADAKRERQHPSVPSYREYIAR